MKTFTEAFLVDEKLTLPEVSGETGQPVSVKTTPTITRVSAEELELTYLHNPTIFNGINKIIQTVMSANHEIRAKDKKVQKWFRDFVANLGNSGAEITWEELLSQIFKFQTIYGKSWIENIFNKRGNRIVDWDYIDPKKMDYAKDSALKLVLDKFGKSVGYFEVIKQGDLPLQTRIESAEVPQGLVQLGVTPPAGFITIFLEPKRIAQTKLFTIGDGFYPIGLIEPIYKTSLRKMNIEEALANAIYRHGFPIVWAKLGDLNHEPTPQQIETMLGKLKNINFKQEIATPYYYDLKILETKKAEKLKSYLDYYRDEEIAGLGIPKPFATGGGEATNRATLQSQSALFQLTLRDLINKTCNSIRMNMFRPVCKLEGFDEVPVLWWDTVGVDEWDKKASRLLKMIKAGVIDPKDPKIVAFVKSAENLKESAIETED